MMYRLSSICICLLIFCCSSNSQKGDLASKTPAGIVPGLGNNIMVIYQDSKNIYWFGSWETGLYRYDGHQVQHFTVDDGLPSNRIEAILEDKSGNLYFNTSGGVSKYNGQKFITLEEAVQPHQDWVLKENDLWFKNLVSSGEVFRYDGDKLYSLDLPTIAVGGEWINKNPNSHTPYDVYTIYTDTKGNIWFGMAAIGVCRFDGKKIDWITEKDVNELHNGPSNGVRSIIEDKEGYFWFNTNYRYNIYGNDKPTNTFYTREPGIGSLDGVDPTFTEYLSIGKDNDDHLWMVSYRAGVYRFDGNKITHYPVQDQGVDITTFCIYKDNSGGLWVGTHENGVFKFNGKGFERW